MGRVDAPGSAAPIVRVAIACSPGAGHAFEATLELPAPATALDAVRASGLLERHPELGLGEPLIGIWGRACAPETLLADGDRVEVYRPLTMDPNEARRLRARNLRAAGRR
jgi:putative ubiquitin-RnfH superfamily antitoxin RatB of RatAB toxin-antitoxin module